VEGTYRTSKGTFFTIPRGAGKSGRKTGKSEMEGLEGEQSNALAQGERMGDGKKRAGSV